ncbi:hypothetical protein [Streptomyces sp. NPDC059850]|uniref:hypothetical protein n=1 Tax=Streptomyces sp. NPDC059850 TaxID=3346970 RepID=UPI003649D1D1
MRAALPVDGLPRGAAHVTFVESDHPRGMSVETVEGEARARLGAHEAILYVDDAPPGDAERDRTAANAPYDRAGFTEVDRLHSFSRRAVGAPTAASPRQASPWPSAQRVAQGWCADIGTKPCRAQATPHRREPGAAVRSPVPRHGSVREGRCSVDICCVASCRVAAEGVKWRTSGGCSGKARSERTRGGRPRRHRLAALAQLVGEALAHAQGHDGTEDLFYALVRGPRPFPEPVPESVRARADEQQGLTRRRRT